MPPWQIWLALAKGAFWLWSSSQGGIPVWFHREADSRNYKPQLMMLNQPLHHWNVTLHHLTPSLSLSLSLSLTFKISETPQLAPRLPLPLALAPLPSWERIKEKPSRETLFINNPVRSVFMCQLCRGWLCLCVVVAKTWLGFWCCWGTSMGVTEEIYGLVTCSYVLSRH